AVLTPEPTGSEAEHDLVNRALVFMATALVAGGQPVLIDAAGERRAWRDLARAALSRFAEVQLARDGVGWERGGPAGLARRPVRVGPEAAADRVAGLALTLERAAPNRRPAGPGAVVWLTGPPGSGKTTLASRVAEGLAGGGAAVALVEWEAVRSMVLAGGGHA